MRTTIDLPDSILKKAKMKAVKDNITLKELFIRSLEHELESSGSRSGLSKAPWKKLQGKGSASGISPTDSGFEGYSGPDWNHSIQVNEPDED
ncbi:MAG: hypothetical protein U5K72_12150 [Balneolaceae bacterium]|nr:hypothetical protein [Balneolaceae bacterium]